MKKLTKKQHRAAIKKSIERNDNVHALRCIQWITELLEDCEMREVFEILCEVADLFTAATHETYYENLTDGDWDKVSILRTILQVDDERHLSFIKTYASALIGK